MSNVDKFRNVVGGDLSEFFPTEMTEDRLKQILTEWVSLKTEIAFLKQFLHNLGNDDISLFLEEVHCLAMEHSPIIQSWLADHAVVEEPEPVGIPMTNEEIETYAAEKQRDLDQLASDLINGRAELKTGSAYKTEKEQIADGVAALAEAAKK